MKWKIAPRSAKRTKKDSKRHILIIKGGRNQIWAFFSSLGASWRYIPFHSILDKSERRFAAFITHIASIWCIWIIKDESLHFFQILYALLKMMNVSMMECWENEIWGFLNPLCAPENEIFLVMESWKKWNLRLLKTSIIFFKILYVLLKMICFNDRMLR